MIFTIAPLVQEAKTTRRWLATLALFTAVLIAVLGLFGAGMTWAGAAVAAQVTTPRAREILASLMLTALGIIALASALGELGLSRPLLPRVTTVPGGGGNGSLAGRAVTVALVFGATMAIFSPLSAYALVIGWVASQRSAWLGAATLMAYGLGLMVPLAIAGTLAAGRTGQMALSERAQARLRVVSGASLALAGGFMLSMWTVRATWAVFLNGAARN
jgi:cytochrome c biogenesis protein CcdA